MIRLRFPHLIVLPLAGLLLSGCMADSHEVTSQTELNREFKDSFGFDALKNADLHCHYGHVGDSKGWWMSFNYDQSAVENIISHGFLVADNTASDFRSSEVWRQDAFNKNPNAPEWWPEIPASKNTVIYAKAQTQVVPQSYTYLWVNDATHKVYVKWASWQ